MSAYTYTIEMQFTSGTWTDVSGDVFKHGGIRVERGIFSRGAAARVAEPGSCSFTLNNSATNSAGLGGYYSLFHANRRTGFGYSIPVRFTLTDAGGSTVQFIGRLTDIDVEPGAYGTRGTRCVAHDAFFGFEHMPIVGGLAVQTNKRADQLVTTLLSSTDPGYGGLYTLSADTGDSTFAYAFDSIQDEAMTVRQELHRILMSEQGYCFMEPATASVRMQSRNGRSLLPATPVQLDDDMVSLVMPSVIDDLPTRVSVTAYPVSPLGSVGSPVVLYSLGTMERRIASGETFTLFGPYTDANNHLERVGGTSFSTVTATTDYTANTALDGSGTDLTANFTATADAKGNGVYWTVTNTGTTAGYLTKLQLRGVGLGRRASTVTATNAYDSTAIRSLAFEMPYESNTAFAQARADYYAQEYANPNVPRVQTVRFLANRSVALMQHGRLRNTGDRVAITETQTGLSGAEFAIQGVRLDCRPAGLMFVEWVMDTDAVATWTSVAYDAADFTGNGSMTWTVGSADVLQFAYRIEGTAMTVAFALATTTVGGTPSTKLQIKVPGNRSIASKMTAPVYILDNSSVKFGFVQAASAVPTKLEILLPDLANWSAATNSTLVEGLITFEVA
ncbi:MAG: hypothetical protein KAY59_11670 [Acidobacteria bacterium]|nr:hypothetical protein [Acidobacteriota bacterium]